MVWMKRLAWVLLICFCWLEVLWLHLPAQKLGRFAALRINQNLDPAYLIRIEEAEPTLFGIELIGFSLWEKSSGQRFFAAEQVSFSLAPWNLARGGAAMDAKIYAGEVRGLLSFFPKEGLQLEGQGIQPNRNLALRGLGVVRSNPALALSLDLTLDNNQLNGWLEARLEGVSLEAKGKDLGLMLDLPLTRFKQIEGRVDFTAEGASIKVTSQGDLSGNITGRLQYVSLNALAQARMNLQLRLKPEPTYWENLGFIAQFAQSFLNPQGQLGMKVTGGLSSPQVEKL